MTVSGQRMFAVDWLRGLAMVLMALDHVRDYFGDFSVNPVDMATTTPALFATRWITHFCAPVFVFLAGTGAWLYAARGRSRAELSRFLWTRGLWLIFLEWTVVRVAWTFALVPGFLPMQVIWAIGGSMVVLAALVRLPVAWIGAFGVAVVVHSRGTEGTLRRAAAEVGIDAVTYEAGEPMRFQRQEIERGVAGVQNLMGHLEMLERDPPLRVGEAIARRARLAGYRRRKHADRDADRGPTVGIDHRDVESRGRLGEPQLDRRTFLALHDRRCSETVGATPDPARAGHRLEFERAVGRRRRKHSTDVLAAECRRRDHDCVGDGPAAGSLHRAAHSARSR